MLEFRIWKNISVLVAHKTAITVPGINIKTRQSVKTVTIHSNFLLMGSVIRVEMITKLKDVKSVIS